MAGMAGFGPTNAGVKVLCLTAWRHPLIITVIFYHIGGFVSSAKPNYFPFAVPLARRKEMRDIISPGPAGVSAAENGGVIGVADNSVCYGKSVRSVARVVDHIVLHIFFGCVHDLAHCAALY